MVNTAVLIAEDDCFMQLMLHRLVLQLPKFTVIATLSDGRSAIQRAISSRPDLVLMDIGLPKMDGITATQNIRKSLPDCRILIVTSERSTTYVVAALAAGATGYCTKDSVRTLLAEAVHSVMNGAVWIDPGIGQKLLPRTQRCGWHELRLYKRLGLDRIECEILHLLAVGHFDEDIASALSISPEEAGSCVQNILSKLEVSNRGQAAAAALRMLLKET